MISLIWAMDSNRLIGAHNQMPWHLPADMAWFRENTLNKSILMGRKTYDSIGKPLPHRQNLILSRQADLHIEGAAVIHHLDALMDAFADSEEELMVMGGAEIYALLLPVAQRLYCTTLAHTFEGDAWFPEYDSAKWQQTHSEQRQADKKNAYNYCFEIYQHR